MGFNSGLKGLTASPPDEPRLPYTNINSDILDHYDTFFAWVANLPTAIFRQLVDIQKILNTSGCLPRYDRAKSNGSGIRRTACLNTPTPWPLVTYIRQ